MTATLQAQQPDVERPPKVRRKKDASSIFDPTIVRSASLDAFKKLNPRTMMRNPVMFIVEVGSVLTTVLFVRDFGSSSTQQNVFAGLVAAFLWFTVLFANFAEAMAEGRGKAQAATLRKTRADTIARVRRGDGTVEERSSAALAVGDLCVVAAGEVIPGDGDVVEGIATVDESAITGESAPVIRESGGDRSAVTGGTRVLSRRDRRAHHGQAGRDVPRPDDRPRRGRRPAEDPERDRPDDPARRLDDHLPARRGDAAAVRHLLRCGAVDHRARRLAGVPHPDHDRRAAVGDRHRRDGPDGAAQRAGDERPGRRSGRGRDHAVARQDRHDHVRLAPGRRVHPGARRRRHGAGRGRADVVARRRDARGPLDRRPRGARLPPRPDRRPRRHDGAVHRPDAHVRHGSDQRTHGAQGRGGLGAPLRRGRGRSGADRAAADRRAGVQGRAPPHSSSSTRTPPPALPNGRSSGSSASRTRSSRGWPSASTSCGRWASAR